MWRTPYKTTTKAGLPVLVVPDGRDLLVQDRSLKNYIAETWRKSMQRDDIYKSSPSLRRDIIWSRIERTLNSPASTVTLALWPDAAGEGALFVVGWLVTGPGTVHYVYVRERYRDAGVAQELLQASDAAQGFEGAPLSGLVPCSHWSGTLPNVGSVTTSSATFSYAGLDWVPQRAPVVEHV